MLMVYSRYKRDPDFEILSKLSSNQKFESSVFYKLNQFVGLRHSIFIDLAARSNSGSILCGLGVDIEV